MDKMLRKLVMVLSGLVVGLGGKRRKALDAIIGDMEKEIEILGNNEEEIERLGFEINKLQMERDGLLKEVADNNRREDELNQLRHELGITLGTSWTLMVSRRVLDDFRILAVKAFREVTGMGLKDAYGWINAQKVGLSCDLATMSTCVTAGGLIMALNTLLNDCVSYKDKPAIKLGEDVVFCMNKKVP